MTERNLDPADAQWVTQALARLYLAFGLLVGVLILIGGANRFSSPSYANALTYPGAPESWGVVVLLLGVAGILCSLLGRVKAAGVLLFGLSIWSFFFAISFTTAAYQDPMAGTTGPAVYSLTTISSIVLSVAHLRGVR